MRDNCCTLFKVGASKICRIADIAKQQIGLVRKSLLQPGGHSRDLIGLLCAELEDVDGPVDASVGFGGGRGFFDHQM